MTMRSDVALFLQSMQASGQPPLDSLPLPEMRAAFAALGRIANAAAPPIAVTRDIAIPAPGLTIAARLFDRREHRGATPIVVFFHGGGFVFGGLDSHAPLCAQIADRLDLPVLAIDYRLAPEHPFPAAADDAEEAVRWVASSPDALGMRITGVATCGDSAGGNLAVVAIRRLAADHGPVPGIAQGLMYPYTGADLTGASADAYGEGHVLTRAAIDMFERRYAAPRGDPRFDLLAAPWCADVPVVVQTAALDPLRDQGLALAAAARAAGSRVIQLEAAGMIHGFATLAGAIPSAMDDINAFIDAFATLVNERVVHTRPTTASSSTNTADRSV